MWVKTVHNVCGLMCILGLTGPNYQVSLTTKERSAQGTVPPFVIHYYVWYDSFVCVT